LLNFKNIYNIVQSRSIAGNKSFYIFLFFILFCCEAKTQTEYITNGSFEQIDSCNGCIANLGFDIFEWSGCKGWSNPIYSSSDLWCTNGKVCGVQPPSLLGYYQYPRTGNNLAGFYIGFQSYYNYREYLQNQLSKTFTNGVNYEISFHVSSNAGSCNISEIGLKFYSSKFSDLSKLQLTPITGNISADVTNDHTNFITDTLGWQKITFNYRANGSENFVIIGCFVDSINLKSDYTCDTTGWIGQIFPGDYIFIDDVSISELPLQEPIFPNVFSPNSDGINDIWKIDLSIFEKIECIIYNRWGNKIFETNNKNIIWDAHTTSGENCTDGSYFYIIKAVNSNKEEKYFKGFIHLVR
jgi:gliding motility-associated-like protein